MGCWSSTIGACSAAAVLILAGCSARPALPHFGAVPDFELIGQDGAAFAGASLTGKVWVAEFFFTNCTGPCPRMNARFRQMQNQLINAPDFRLVSFTVDPGRDTQEALADYARRFQARPGRWFFLTGPREALNHLGLNVFLLGGVGGGLEHSTKFVLVDRARSIRGFYRSEDPDAMKKLVEDIKQLLKEPA